MYGEGLKLRKLLAAQRARRATAADATAADATAADEDSMLALEKRGVLAGVEVMMPYFQRALRTAFPEAQLNRS